MKEKCNVWRGKCNVWREKCNVWREKFNGWKEKAPVASSSVRPPLPTAASTVDLGKHG